MTIRVIIADDQELVRIGFGLILSSADEIEVVAQCANGVEAIELIRKLQPDVALLDIRMPLIDGLEVCRQTSDVVKVVIVTTFGEDEYIDRGMAYGASGFLLKDSGPDLLIAAVRAASIGEVLISPSLTIPLLERTRNRAHAGPPLSPAVTKKLTARETQVAHLIACGLTNTEIAQELSISISTVKTHFSKIQSSLGARNRVEIAAKVCDSGGVGELPRRLQK